MEQHDLTYQLQNLRQNTSPVGIYVTVLFMVLLAVIMICFATLSWVNWVWMIPLMGWIQYYIVISGHEAVHKTLCPNRQLNEWVGVIGQAMVGVNFTAYRLQHIDHHRAPTYETDPDAHIYMGVLKQQPGIRRLLWLTLGTLVEIVIKIRQRD